jgi:hypothetical protein
MVGLNRTNAHSSIGFANLRILLRPLRKVSLLKRACIFFLNLTLQIVLITLFYQLVLGLDTDFEVFKPFEQCSQLSINQL